MAPKLQKDDWPPNSFVSCHDHLSMNLVVEFLALLAVALSASVQQNGVFLYQYR